MERQIVVKLHSLVPLTSSQEASIVEHVLGEWIESPEVAFAGISWLARYLDEAIVETVERENSQLKIDLEERERRQTNLRL